MFTTPCDAPQGLRIIYVKAEKSSGADHDRSQGLYGIFAEDSCRWQGHGLVVADHKADPCSGDIQKI